MEQIEQREEIRGGVFFQYFKSATTVLAGFIFYVYIIHFYSSEFVGTVALLLAIVQLVGVLFSLGLGFALQHYISYHIGRKEYGSVVGMAIKFSIIGISLAALSVTFLYFSSPIFVALFFHTSSDVVLVKYLGIDVFFATSNAFLGNILIGLQKFKSQAMWATVGTLVGYFLSVVLLSIFNSGILMVIGWAAGSAMSTIAFLALISRGTRGLSEIRSAVGISPVFSYAFPLFIASLVGYGANYTDRLIVSHLLNLSLLGIYNFALLISSAIGFLSLPFSTILLPKLSEMYGLERREDMKKYVSKGIELLSTIYVPIAMLIAALSASILLFLSNEEYLPATIPIMIVLVTSSIFVSVNILGISLQSIRKTNVFLITSSSALVSNMVLSVLLVPRFQMIGASIGYSSVTAVSFFITYYYARKFDVLKFEGLKIVKIYTSAVVMFFAVFELQRLFLYSPLKLFLYIFVGFAIYSGTIKVLRTFSKDDMEFVMGLLPWGLQRIRVVISALFL